MRHREDGLMKNLFSVMVLAASFALLVPDISGQSVSAAESYRSAPVAMAASHGVMGAPAASDNVTDVPAKSNPDFAWLLALGFLGTVMARRLRAD
jgi:hypothetical protein